MRTLCCYVKQRRTYGTAMNTTDRIVRPAEMAHLLGISRTTLYRMIKDDLIDPPFQICGSSRAVGWFESRTGDYIRAAAVRRPAKDANGMARPSEQA